MAKKILLKVRYPDDPDREWITLEREKGPTLSDRLTPEQLEAVAHSRTWARVALVAIILFALVCLRGCNL